MKLTDSIIKAAKPREKDYSLADGHGLALLVKSSGAKWGGIDTVSMTRQKCFQSAYILTFHSKKHAINTHT